MAPEGLDEGVVRRYSRLRSYVLSGSCFLYKLTMKVTEDIDEGRGQALYRTPVRSTKMTGPYVVAYAWQYTLQAGFTAGL